MSIESAKARGLYLKLCILNIVVKIDLRTRYLFGQDIGILHAGKCGRRR